MIEMVKAASTDQTSHGVTTGYWLPSVPAFDWRYIASGCHDVSYEPGPAGVLGRPGADRPTRRPSVVWNAAGRGEGRRR